MAAMVGSHGGGAAAKSDLQGRISSSGRSVIGLGWRGKVESIFGGRLGPGAATVRARSTGCAAAVHYAEW